MPPLLNGGTVSLLSSPHDGRVVYARVVEMGVSSSSTRVLCSGGPG